MSNTDLRHKTWIDDYSKFSTLPALNIDTASPPEDVAYHGRLPGEKIRKFLTIPTLLPVSLYSAPELIQSPTINPSKGRSIIEKYLEGFLGQNSEAVNKGIDALGNITNSLPGADNTYNGPKGNVRASIDLGYNAIADTAANFGPYGQLVSGVMKAANMLNGVQGAIFGATDGMTTTDAIMDSPLGFLTGLGWANQAFGKKSNTITKNEEAFALVGSSYGGTNASVDDALNYSGKKYGAFSSGARKDANALIAENRRLQNMVEDISNEAATRQNLLEGMSAIAGNRRALELLGGYNLSSIRVGRKGLSIKSILAAKRVASTYSFIKKPIEEPQPIMDNFQQGGVLELTLQNIPEEYLESVSVVEEVTLDSILPEFKEGGKVNVIPEGALHARLHHMENSDNLTKKGIPVVTEKEGGELEQLAEIEREEIIFRLEVTKKLEELYEKYSDDGSSLKDKEAVAIEAGKLLVEEIINNTIDNTGLLNNIN